METLTTYKGFDNDLKCRDKQYEIGKEYEEKDIKICKRGFHACEFPLEVWDHYDMLNSRFCEVEQSGEIQREENTTKICSSKIKIKAELKLADIIKLGVDWLIKKTSNKKENTGDYAQIGSSGYSAQIDSTGQDSVICCAGKNSAAKAKKGSWITLSEWMWSEEKRRNIPKCVKTECVDGERIKEDTWYKLIDGEFKKVKL